MPDRRRRSLSGVGVDQKPDLEDLRIEINCISREEMINLDSEPEGAKIREPKITGRPTKRGLWKPTISAQEWSLRAKS